MRNGTLLVVATVALALGLGVRQAPAQQVDLDDANEGFEFVVEVSESSVRFVSLHGTYWSTLSWGASGSDEIRLWITRHGVSSVEPRSGREDFVIRFEATPSGTIMKSKSGARWSELSYSCGRKSPCMFLVDETGVRGLSDPE